jgi:predicted kinase
MSGELIVLIGLPGSGKTEHATRVIQNAAVVGRKMYRVNWDDLRKELWHTGAFDARKEDHMKKVSVEQVKRAIRTEDYADVIIDNTNLTESTRNMWRGVANELNLTYVEVELCVPAPIAVQRDAQRSGDAQVGRAVIERMALWSNKISFLPSATIIEDRNLVLVDVDGTLANNSHRAGIVAPIPCPSCDGFKTQFRPDSGTVGKCKSCFGTGQRKKDWYSFYKDVSNDAPILPVIGLVHTLREAGYIILVVSGRPIRFLELEVGKQTVQWLKEMGVEYEHIFMRQAGDKRPDTVVKKEILDKLPKDRIAYVIDDRNSVVEMWRKEGLTCLQVAEGAF